MSTPVFILAGQSNAAALSVEIESALEDRYGLGNFELLNVFSSGAPLTRERGDLPDWRNPTEMREDLTENMIALLDEDPDRVVGGMIWVQGEADTYNSYGAARYGDDLEGLIDEFRDEVSNAFGARDTGLDVAPVTILELSDNAPAAPEREAWDMVISEQREVAASDALVTTVDPDRVAQIEGVDAAEMFKDGLHYADDFQFDLASDLVETMGPPSMYGIEAETEPGGGPIEGPSPSPEVPPVDPQDPSTEPLFPVVDPVLPNEEDDEAEFQVFDDGGGGLGDIGWLLAFLPLLGALG